jgi:phage tail-like protein
VSRTPHFLLGLRVGWRAQALQGAALDGDPPRLRLASVPEQGRPLVDAGGSFGGLTLPLGVAVDADDRVYVLCGDQHIRRFEPCQCRFETLDCIGGSGGDARNFIDACALDISCSADLFVADRGARRIAVFAVKGLALRALHGPFVLPPGPKLRLATSTWQPRQPLPTGLWLPVDLAIGPQQRLHVCDNANGAVHVFSAQGRYLRSWRGPDAAPLAKPLRIAVDSEERCYVIEDGSLSVRVFAADGQLLATVQGIAPIAQRFCPTSIAVDAQGNLLLGDRFARLVRVQSAAQACDGIALDDASLTSCADLAFDRHGNPYGCDPARGCVVQFAGNAAYAGLGVYTSQALDSETWQCVWHRVALVASVPAGTSITVASFTSETELAPAEINALPDAAWATQALHSASELTRWDCLLLGTPGRHLWLRLTLCGNGSLTPTLRSAVVEFPRGGSIEHLPSIYRDETGGGDFLARFLAMFDTERAQVDALLEAFAGRLDPCATPAPDFLDWLASWLGIALDRHWPVERQRELVRQAWRLYELRGTPQGLALHLQIYTGQTPRILEHYRLRQWLYASASRLGDASRLYGQEIVRRLQLDEFSRIGDFTLIDTDDPVHDPFAVHAHRFTVYVPLPEQAGDLFRNTVARIVEQAKPAHAEARIVYVQPRLRIGVQSWIGLDTVIGAWPTHTEAGSARLGQDSVLGPGADAQDTPTLRIGSSSRIGPALVLD